MKKIYFKNVVSTLLLAILSIGVFGLGIEGASADLATEKLLYITEKTVAKIITTDDGTVYAGTSDNSSGSHYVYAININGNEKWTYEIQEKISSLAISPNKNTIYAGSYDDSVYAIDANDGTLMWSYEADGNVYSVSAKNETVYIGSDDNKIYAINSSNGEVEWEYRNSYGDIRLVLFSDKEAEYNSQAYTETVYALSGNGHIYAFNTDGTIRWSQGSDIDNLGYIAIGDDGSIYTAGLNNNSSVYAISPNGDRKWKSDIAGYVDSFGAKADGTVYVGMYKQLLTLDPIDGSVINTRNVNGNVTNISIENNEMLIGENGFSGTFLDLDTGKIKWSSPIAGTNNYNSTNYISNNGDLYAVVGNKIYVVARVEPSADDAFLLKWNQELDGNVISMISGENGAVYAKSSHTDPETSNDIHTITSINSENGDINWSHLTHTNKAMAAGQDGTVYAGAGSNIVAFTPESPAEGVEKTTKWSFATLGEVKEIAISENNSEHNGTIYVFANNAIHAIDPNQTKESEEEKWNFPLTGGYSNLISIGDDDTIYVSSFGWSSDRTTYAINPDGTEKWRLSLGARAMTISDDGTKIYTASYSDNNIYELNILDGSTNWTYAAEGMNFPDYSGVVVAPNGAIYTGYRIGYEGSYLHAINPDGTFNRQYKLSGTGTMKQIALSEDGMIYAATDKDVYIIDPTDGAVKTKYKNRSKTVIPLSNNSFYTDSGNSVYSVQNVDASVECADGVWNGGYNMIYSSDELIGCTSITGSVIINGMNEDALIGLNNITEIQGDLIFKQTNINHISGLDALTSIGGSLILHKARGGSYSSPANFSGFDRLRTIGKSFLITNESNSSAYETISGFNALESIGENFDTGDYNRLRTISGFSNLEEINGGLNMTNSNLFVIPEFNSLRIVDGDINFSSSYAYGDAITRNGFNALEMINGNLNISNISKLGELSTFPSLNTINGNLQISSVNILETISGFNNLNTLTGDLIIDSLGSLTSITDFASLTKINSLTINNNEKLAAMSGLESLLALDGDLTITNNAAITSVGTENITSLGGAMIITGNATLSTCDARTFRDALSDNGWNGSSEIRNNNSTISCLCPTGTLDGDYIVDSEEKAEELSGCINTTGNITIQNSELTNLNYFNTIKTIGGNLTIQNNDNLTDIYSLSTLEELTGGLSIRNNSALYTCKAENIRDQLINDHGWNGTTTIAGNNDSGTCLCDDGIISWQHEADDQGGYNRIKFASSDNGVYVGRVNYLRGFDLNGRMKWTYDTQNNEPIKRVIIDKKNDSTVYASDEDAIYSIDTETGIENWRHSIDADFYPINIYDNALYYYKWGSLHRIDSDGNESWSMEYTNYSDIKFDSNGNLYTFYYNEKQCTRSYDLDTGQENGSHCPEVGEEINKHTATIAPNGDQYFDGNNGVEHSGDGIYAVSANQTKKWFSAIGKSHYIEYHNNVIYAVATENTTGNSADDKPHLKAINAETGDELWSIDDELWSIDINYYDNGDYDILYLDHNTLYLRSEKDTYSEDGKTYFITAYDLDGNEKWTHYVDEENLTNLRFDEDGLIYAELKNNTLYVINTDGTRRWEYDNFFADYLEIHNKTVFITDEDFFYAIEQACTLYECSDGVWNGDHIVRKRTDLGSLSGCTSITGDLNINHPTEDLGALNGIEYITSIGGDLTINSDNYLTNINELSNLTSLGGDLTITNNGKLSNCNALELEDNLIDEGWSGNVNFSENIPSYTCLCKDDGIYEGNYTAANVNDTEQVYGCTGITGDLTIQNTNLENLDYLGRLKHVDGNITVSGNNDLKNILGYDLRHKNDGGVLEKESIGFEQLKTLGGTLTVENNASLSSCKIDELQSHLNSNGLSTTIINSGNTGSESCLCPGGVLSGDYTINSVDDAEKILTCSSITGNLTISGSDIIYSSFLEKITSIGGDLTITSNGRLKNLFGLENLTSLGGKLTITNNLALRGCESASFKYNLETNLGWTGESTLRGGSAEECLCPGYEEKWDHDSEGDISGGPIKANDDMLYTTTGRLLDSIYPDGTRKWSYDVGISEYIGYPPLASNDSQIAYVTTFPACRSRDDKYSGDPSIHAIHSNGTNKWIYTLSKLKQPAIDNNNNIYATAGEYTNGDNSLYILNSDGAAKSITPLVIPNSANLANNASPAVVSEDNNTIYITDSEGFYAINLDGSIRWYFDNPDQ